MINWFEYWREPKHGSNRIEINRSIGIFYRIRIGGELIEKVKLRHSKHSIRCYRHNPSAKYASIRYFRRRLIANTFIYEAWYISLHLNKYWWHIGERLSIDCIFAAHTMYVMIWINYSESLIICNVIQCVCAISRTRWIKKNVQRCFQKIIMHIRWLHLIKNCVIK